MAAFGGDFDKSKMVLSDDMALTELASMIDDVHNHCFFEQGSGKIWNPLFWGPKVGAPAGSRCTT